MGWQRSLLWASGLWVSPLWWVALRWAPASSHALFTLTLAGLAPLPAILVFRHREERLRLRAKQAWEQVESLKLRLEAIRHRTGLLRDELSAADSQARFSRQLAMLGQFTAGFLHEFNNPLAILSGRIEVLLQERRDDAALRADLDQMLKEARYMGKIAGTLLRALRRERMEETFEPSMPAEALREVLASLGPSAEKRRVRLAFEPAEVPRVNLPSHVLIEVARALITNALEALPGRKDDRVWVRLETYHRPGSKVVMRVEDNGPGVPDTLRDHLFERFVSRKPNGQGLGLGLFLAASLLNAYDASLRYEPREGGGARFVVELPPGRFTQDQPYHWFVRGVSS